MRPQPIPLAAPLILMLVAATACGTSRDALLGRTMAGLDAAERVFIAEDMRQQQALVDAATSKEEGHAALAAYRARRDKVATSFALAYGAVALASVEMTDTSLHAAISAAGEVVRAMRALFLTGGES